MDAVANPPELMTQRRDDFTTVTDRLLRALQG